MKNYFSVLLLGCLLSACNKSEVITPSPENPPIEAIPELRLSAKWNTDIEGVDFEFEILDGNGGYTASFSKPNEGKAIIQGNRVKVDLLTNHVYVTITDKKQQTKTIIINSAAKSLIPHDYSISIGEGDTYIMKNISFGAGGYTIKKTSGTSATATVDQNDYVQIEALSPGNSYYQLIDQRGSTAPLEVKVTKVYDLMESMINVTAINDQTLSVVLKYGNGGWKITTREPYDPIIDKLYLHHNGTADKKHDVLQINTARGEVNGSCSIELQDSNGSIAIISLTVK